MIYQKESNFPYPILSSLTDDYLETKFIFDVDLFDVGSSYNFVIKYDIESRYIQLLLSRKQAKIYIVFESDDAKFYEVENNEILIKKSRISLRKNTKIQLFIVLATRVNLSENHEIDEFYDSIKSRIFLNKGNVIAISNVVKFDGDLKKPFDLFLKQFDSTISSDIKIDLGNEMIIIKYKDKKYQFTGFRRSNTLNNHYVYIGLTKALYKFISDLGEGEEQIFLNDLEEPEENSLYKKIFHLLKVKKIESISFENIDEVIHLISDRIIEKHFNAIKELNENAT